MKHIDSSKNCLEIGAHCNPFFDHSKGNTKNADIFKKNQLIELYKDCPQTDPVKCGAIIQFVDQLLLDLAVTLPINLSKYG